MMPSSTPAFRLATCLRQTTSLLGSPGLIAASYLTCSVAVANPAAPVAAEAASEDLLGNIRQITFSGKRAGEGYFSADGKRMVFQSERDPANPFFQIFLLDFESGETTRVSPGTGKTTCAWLHPNGKRVIFASTHLDPSAEEKQKHELKQREEGKQKRYAWDYDEFYEIFSANLDGSDMQNLTKVKGYDAEGAISPDGSSIVFASNRHAYKEPLPEADRERFERQKSWLMDIYLMNSDGTDVRRLTDVKGYDGGPFFSADGKKICWRRFNDDEDRAEIWTMNADGSNQRQITRMDVMSWAPFFHPSGQYLVFTTNKHGFDNFELYIVDAEGKSEPRRITTTPGFDGLASFSPDGQRLTWTSNRTSDQTSQIFLADWDHAAALASLGLGGGKSVTAPQVTQLSGEISADDLRRHVSYLASPEMEGRMTGTKGEMLATGYAAQVFRDLGLEPAGTNGTYFAPFEFTAGVELGEKNSLTTEPSGATEVVRKSWIPLTFSQNGEITAGVVFAGYGLDVAASRDDKGNAKEAYSSYVHLDVKDKWVLMFRYLPESFTQEERVRFAASSTLRRKAMIAREKGAKGIIVISGPNSKVISQLVPLSFDASLAGSGVAAISVTDALADSWLKLAGKDLKSLQDTLDKGELIQGFAIPGLTLTAHIDIRQEKKTGRNVIARLPAAEKATPPEPALLIGAHIDHLGTQGGTESRASDEDKSLVHFGADDNASGVAGLFEIAQLLAQQKASGEFKSKRDILFACWSGEELGLLGSSAWMREQAAAAGDENGPLNTQFAAALNMDMIGRFQKALVLQGIGSSDYWTGAIEKRNFALGLPITVQADCFLPTDATSFYLRKIPIFNAFTGSHDDYHKPTDTPQKLDYPATAKIANFMGLVLKDLALTTEEPPYKEMKKPAEGNRSGFRVYLGTIPDYAQGDVEGVKLSGVSAVGPAAKAGLKAGDIIVKLAGKEIKNIYEFTDVLSVLKIG